MPPIKPESLLLNDPSPQDLKMFEFYKKNPSLAAMDLLGQDLAPFQRIVVDGIMKHSYVISVLARGSGKTRMMAMCAALLCMFNPKMRVGFLAPGFRQAKLSFSEFEAILSESAHLEACVKRVSKQTDQWSVEFHNGAFCFALPLAADSAASIRGVRLHAALIDEYPHVPKETLDLVINPMLATQRNPMANVRRIQKEKELLEKGLITEKDLKKQNLNKICGFSSAYFKFNHMFKTMETYRAMGKKQLKDAGQTDYGVYVFNYLDAPEGFFDAKMIEHAKATSSEIAFAMEYLSEFPSDSDGFYKRSLLDSCKIPGLFKLELLGDSSGRYFLGVDPARNSDNFAISIIKIQDGKMRLVRTLSFSKTPFPVIAGIMRRLCEQYPIEMIGMDAGGGGLAMKDLLEDPTNATSIKDIILDMDDEENVGKQGRKILKMVNFASKWISDANFEMKASMEHKALLFPDLSLSDTYIRPEGEVEDDVDNAAAEFFKLIDELQSIVMTATKTGVLHFDTNGKNQRKDRYTSLLIAHKVAHDFIQNGFQKKELASGGFIGPGGILMTPDIVHEEFAWETTKVIDELAAQHRKVRAGIEDAALG